jgi:hypothetical protein
MFWVVLTAYFASAWVLGDLIYPYFGFNAYLLAFALVVWITVLRLEIYNERR